MGREGGGVCSVAHFWVDGGGLGLGLGMLDGAFFLCLFSVKVESVAQQLILLGGTRVWRARGEGQSRETIRLGGTQVWRAGERAGQGNHKRLLGILKITRRLQRDHQRPPGG